MSSSYQYQLLSTQLWNALININVNFNCANFSLSIVSYQCIEHLWYACCRSGVADIQDFCCHSTYRLSVFKIGCSFVFFSVWAMNGLQQKGYGSNWSPLQNKQILYPSKMFLPQVFCIFKTASCTSAPMIVQANDSISSFLTEKFTDQFLLLLKSILALARFHLGYVLFFIMHRRSYRHRAFGRLLFKFFEDKRSISVNKIRHGRRIEPSYLMNPTNSTFVSVILDLS